MNCRITPSHIMFLIKKRRSADVLLTLKLEVTVQNPITSIWTVTFKPTDVFV